MKRLRVAVIFGGRSGEHEVSLVSARSVIANLNPKKYNVTGIKISKSGLWEDGKGSLTELRKNFDIVFPVLHGTFGEDGTIQGMLEMAGIPYVGCGVEASAVSMDKFTSKMLFAFSNFPQTKFLHFSRAEVKKNARAITAEIQKKIGFPCFVKPSNLGSSIGVSKVKIAAALGKALRLAASYDSSILVEKGVDAREIEVAVFGNENPKASIAGEIVSSNEFYDYNAKYVDNKSQLFIPAKISSKKMEEVQQLAVKAFALLQCSGMARVDFLMDRRTGKLYLNELNTIPGFTSISMYPKLWKATGIPYPTLLERLIELGLDRHRAKNENAYHFESGSSWFQK